MAWISNGFVGEKSRTEMFGSLNVVGLRTTERNAKLSNAKTLLNFGFLRYNMFSITFNPVLRRRRQTCYHAY